MDAVKILIVDKSLKVFGCISHKVRDLSLYGSQKSKMAMTCGDNFYDQQIKDNNNSRINNKLLVGNIAK